MEIRTHGGQLFEITASGHMGYIKLCVYPDSRNEGLKPLLASLNQAEIKTLCTALTEMAKEAR